MSRHVLFTLPKGLILDGKSDEHPCSAGSLTGLVSISRVLKINDSMLFGYCCEYTKCYSQSKKKHEFNC